ncbi:hypothetical protein H6P87_00081 [Rickettsia tillamookensis]|uniref:Uncharacterized protein n=2 Tax=Rickettsia tillamookensis TaxID=2761623 RepID=A0A9E6SPZ5_9RICK|nr:hypothetical protein H6P87_00081 [Rickettsia tillamookensis]
MIKFLIDQKGADFRITTNNKESSLYFCVRNLNFETTKYYLELGEEIPLTACSAVGARTNNFLQKLGEYFQTKLNQESDNIKYQDILVQIQERQKENIIYISNNSDELTNITVNEQNKDTTNLIGEENA